MSRIQSAAARQIKPELDPFRLGWRYVTRLGEDGAEVVEQVPLTEWDILHPQEDDFIVQNYAHTRDCIYLKESVESVTSGRSDVLVLCDHRVDWQEPGVLPHGPDITALGDVRKPWDPRVGTFSVHDMGATVLLAVEVTSPSTWKADVDKKVDEYFLAKVPYYVIVDARETKDGQSEVVVVGYGADTKGYVRLPVDADRGIWIPTVEIWLKAEGDRVRCLDRDGNIIPDRAELANRVLEAMRREAEAEARAEQEKRRAEELEKRADQETRRAELEANKAAREKKRADREKAQAKLEKARADAAEARVHELEAQLKNSKRKK